MVVVVSPYLYYLFAFGSPGGQICPLHDYSADLLNFVLPAPTNALGTIPRMAALQRRSPPCGIAEVDAYVGLPLIVLAAAYAWRHWHEPTGKLLVDSLIIMCVLAMGPLLHFRGAVVCALPGKILAMMPLLNKALPARLMMYSFLLLAIIVSLWFAANQFALRGESRTGRDSCRLHPTEPVRRLLDETRRLTRVLYHRSPSAIPCAGRKCTDSAIRDSRRQYAVAGRDCDVLSDGWRLHSDDCPRSFGIGQSSMRSSTRRTCPTRARN